MNTLGIDVSKSPLHGRLPPATCASWFVVATRSRLHVFRN